MKLVWREGRCPIFGRAFQLEGLPVGSSGDARRNGSGKRYVAHAFIAGHYLNHHGGTLRSAMNHLEREICRRSIGLLGVDDLEFETVKGVEQ